MKLERVAGGHMYVTSCNSGDCGGTCFACCCGWCDVCGGAEGALPTDCPGIRMRADLEQAVYQGKVDFRDGVWCEVASVSSPEHYRRNRK